MASPKTVEGNAWTLRCMFNGSNVVVRHAAGEFSAIIRDGKNVSKKTNHPKDTRSRMITYRDHGGNEVATAHHYVCPNGQVTEPDPKTLTIGNLRYTIHPVLEVANPELRFSWIWMRRCYGWIRKTIICPVFGPRDVLAAAVLL